MCDCEFRSECLVRNFKKDFGFKKGDRVLVAFPYFANHGMIFGTVVSVLDDGFTIAVDDFGPDVDAYVFSFCDILMLFSLGDNGMYRRIYNRVDFSSLSVLYKDWEV